MKTIEEIQIEMRSIVELAETEDRDLTEDDQQRYEKLEGKLKLAQKSDEIMKRQKAYEAPAASLAAAVNVAAPKPDDTEMRAFSAYLRTGTPNSDMVESRAQVEGTSTAGGYTVPAPMLDRIITRVKLFGGTYSQAEVLTTSSGETLRFPFNDDTANKAVIVGENAAPTSGGADLAWGNVSVGAYTWTTSGAGNAPIAVSWQLIQDSNIDIAAYVADRIAERLARGQADYWVNGTGTGQPFGITTNTTTTHAFTGATIDVDDLIDTIAAVDPGYLPGGVWIFNNQTLADIRKLKDGNGRPLWLAQAESGLENTIGGTLLGYPVAIDPSFASYTDATANKWGVFGNVQAGYLIRQVAGMRLIANEFTGQATATVQYTAHVRSDATVKNPYAYAVLENTEA